MDPSAAAGPGGPPGGAPGGAPGGGPPGGAFAGPPDPRFIPAPPSPAAESLAYAFAKVTIALNIISFLLLLARIATRSFPAFRMAWDDYLIVGAWAFMFASSVLLLRTLPYALGGDPSTFTLADVIEANRLAVLSLPLWAWCMALIKMSVCAMLLRLQQSVTWRRFLWGMIAATLVVSVYNTLFQVLQCIPLHAAWDLLGLVKDAKCVSKEGIRINLICISAFNILTDIISAMMPVTFLKKVQIPLRERIVIGLLMALGLFAAVASTLKAVYSANFGRTDDFNLEGITVGTWSVIEEHTAFIAACIPCLRSPFQRLLERCGILTPRGTTVGASGAVPASGGYGRMTGDRDGTNLRGAISMRSMKSTGHGSGQSEEDILSSQKAKNGEIWCTTEVNVEAAEGNGRAVNMPRRDWENV
ncbi:hypothetical protein VTJ83DRAFT_3791 [Remersonia thermophila]|uniref:Rhodopsin domain-containing protein n=1 Tax=Remersonia thermophila TaxID=72144 RepID=A0ABR4DF57_9PEZI